MHHLYCYFLYGLGWDLSCNFLIVSPVLLQSLAELLVIFPCPEAACSSRMLSNQISLGMFLAQVYSTADISEEQFTVPPTLGADNLTDLLPIWPMLF